MSDTTWATQRMRLGDLKEWDKNPRQLTKHDYEHIGKSIETFGLADPLIVNADGSLIGGHQRKRVMLGNGATDDTLVDVRVPDRQLSEREAEELNVRLNRNTGDWDFDILANEFEIDDLLDWGFTEYDLEIGGFDLDEEPPEDPGAQIDRAEELREQWGVETGQLWQVGDHRIICGDCTDAEVVARLMGEERADLGLHDPPYGIDAPNMPLGLGKKNFLRVDFDKDRVDISHLLGASDKCIIWGGNYYSDILPVTNDWLCWDKKNPNLSYSEFELAWSNIGKSCRIISHHWSGEEKNHPTQKPLPVIEWCLSLTDGLIVVDYYSGICTTLVACQRLGRIGRGIEISPAYVAVSLQRLADMGLEPELIDK